MYSLKKGYTLLEAVVVIGIITTLSTGVVMGYGKFQERLELEEAKIMIITNLGVYRDKAYYNGRNYKVYLHTGAKYIEFWENSSHIKKERYELPKNLSYKIPVNSGDFTGNLDSQLSFTGNLSDALTIYICGRDGKARYRIGFYNFLPLKYLVINLYRNVKADQVYYHTIESYHGTNESKNLIGWEKVK